MLASGIAQYLGLRFAKAPTEDFRWRAPAEPDRVEGDQAANTVSHGREIAGFLFHYSLLQRLTVVQFGKICLGISTILPSETEDEDCLFANVWAPANATVDSKLPVWLFIQGGGTSRSQVNNDEKQSSANDDIQGYTINSNPNWNGSHVVEVSGRNIVFVNFNYRVGLFGFLASERVRADGDLNVGLLDQRLMMQWVQKHISQVSIRSPPRSMSSVC